MLFKRKAYIHRKRVSHKRPTTVRRAVKKAVVKVKDAHIKKVVKRVLATNEEVKVAVGNFNLNMQSLQPTTSSVVGNYFVINPSNSTSGFTIARGTANNQMIGNRIKLKSARLKFVLTPNPYDATTNVQAAPLNVRCFFYKSKISPFADPVTSQLCGGSAVFFENGSTYIGFEGNLFDMNKKISSEGFTYLGHRTYKLGPAIPQDATGATVPFYQLSNNDYKWNYIVDMDVTKWLPKTQDLNDSGTWDTPYIVMIWQVVRARSSTTPVSTSQLLASVDGQVFYRYTDA